MILSDKTTKILQNFSKIATNGADSPIFIESGSTIKVFNQSESEFAVAHIEEQFPIDFGIYRLKEFFNALALFTSPNLDFNQSDKYVVISDLEEQYKSNSVKYSFCRPDLIYQKHQNPKEFLQKISHLFAVKDKQFEFKITQEQLKKINQAARNLHLDTLTIEADGKELIIVIHNQKINDSTLYKIVIDKTNKIFKLNYDIDLLNFIDDDYIVTLDKRKRSNSEIVYCTTFNSNSVNYWIALKDNSEI